MATVYCVWVGVGARDNLDFGLARGRWAFRGTAPDLAPGDLLLFGAGVFRGPRIPDADWHASRLSESFLARVLSPPYLNTEPFWPDEVAELRYNPTVDIEFLGALGDLSLRPGEDLDETVVQAMKASGANVMRAFIATQGDTSPALRRVLDLPRPAPPPAASVAPVRLVPVERHETDISVRSVPGEPISAVRREQRLVNAYRDHLAGKQHATGRLEIKVDGTTLRSDIIDVTRNAMIEAKGTASRDAIRMAIGQLADYSRFMPQPPTLRGVLIPESPSDDLAELLQAAGAIAVWPDGDGFVDSAGGQLT